MKHYTREELERLGPNDTIEHRATEEEVEGLRLAGSNYSVARYLLRDCSEEGIIHIQPEMVSWCLFEDGLDRLPCVSSSTRLSKLVRMIGPRPELW